LTNDRTLKRIQLSRKRRGEYGGESRVSRIIHEGKFRDARLAIAISAPLLWAIASVFADERVRISNYLEKYSE